MGRNRKYAAYWASWADALHMIAGRLPEVANRWWTNSTKARIWRGASRRCQQLQIGWTAKVSWGDPVGPTCKREFGPVSQEPGEWLHGWQHHASSASEYLFRETGMIAQSCAADQAHLRSHSGPGSGEVFHGSPTQVEFQLQPGIYRTLLLE